MELAKDPVIEAYKRYVDRTLLRETLKLTPEHRLQNLARWQELALELRTLPDRGKRAFATSERASKAHLLFKALADANVDYFLGFNASAIAHGAMTFEMKLDLVCSVKSSNIARLSFALASLSPRLRGRGFAPWSEHSLSSSQIIPLQIDALDLAIDLVGGRSGHTYGDLIEEVEHREAFGLRIGLLSRRALMRLARSGHCSRRDFPFDAIDDRYRKQLCDA